MVFLRIDTEDLYEGNMAKRTTGISPTTEVPDPYLVALGANIAAARKRAGMTIQSLMAASEVSDVSIWMIENGERNPFILTLNKIALALKTTPQALLPDQDDGLWSAPRGTLKEDSADNFQRAKRLLEMSLATMNALTPIIDSVPELSRPQAQPPAGPQESSASEPKPAGIAATARPRRARQTKPA